MDLGGFELIMRPGTDPAACPTKPPLPPTGYARFEEDGLVFERNVPVKMRDGITIYADIFRPAGPFGEADLGVLLAWSPYGKHGKSTNLWPAAGIEEGWNSRHTAFEAPDPAFWCPLGYAVVYPDPRGAWLSEGSLRHNGVGEGQDCYDLIEWLGVQPWSNGKVGMTGVSYLAAIQYLVAPMKPPHLVALNPWEGFSDWYREFAYHGGIRETVFIERASTNLNWSTTSTEDSAANARAHPLYDAYWRSKEVDLEAIDLPLFVVASWSDHGLHTRGTLEAYKHASSPHKWLLVHGQKKWRHYYDPASRELQRQFFDHFLKSGDDRVLEWPKVRIQTRDHGSEGPFRDEPAWPLARADSRKLWLDAGSSRVSFAPPSKESQANYDPLADDGRAIFDIRFDAETEITGHIKLRLWVEADGAEDMDMFVGLEKLDAQGDVVPFTFYALFEDGPLALGWLRASHRALDPARSTPEQPVHPHDREEPLVPGEPVPLEIEIWPTSVRFAPGEGLRLVVQGRDLYRDNKYNLAFARHEDLRNAGRHIVRTGGRYDAHLLVPMIPPQIDDQG
ncbi:MAG: CocE/NonD family hydrolase [Janthinobacterium lividum]